MLSLPTQAQDTNPYLYIAHAASGRNISSTTNPEFPVDISVDGYCLVKGESFGEIKGPLAGPAGDYGFVVSPANSALPCSNPAVYSVTVPLAAGSTSLGIITLDASSHIIGQLYGLDLSTVPAGSGRVVVANATQQSLSATLTNSGSGGGSASVSIAANSDEESYAPAGEYTGSVYLDGSTTPVIGPLNVAIASRDLYLYVLAGSATNESLQLIGPKVIRDVF